MKKVPERYLKTKETRHLRNAGSEKFWCSLHLHPPTNKVSTLVRLGTYKPELMIPMAAAPPRPELGEACPLSEAHRARLYADEYAFLEKELFASLIRRNILVRLIGRESSMHLGGSSEQKELDFHPRSYFCPYYWTKRARQLTRASEEEGPKLRNLLNRRSRLLEKLEDERLCILDRADGSKDQYECVPASAEAWFRAGCVHGPSEQNIGRAPCTDEALDEDLESQMAALVFRGSHLCVSSDVPGTWPDPLPEAPPMESAQHVRLRPPRSTQICAV